MATSCASSRQFVDVPNAKVPEDLKIACEDPTSVPKRVLKNAEVIGLWNEDRLELRNCKRSKEALVDAVNRIEGGSIK